MGFWSVAYSAMVTAMKNVPRPRTNTGSSHWPGPSPRMEMDNSSPASAAGESGSSMSKRTKEKLISAPRTATPKAASNPERVTADATG